MIKGMLNKRVQAIKPSGIRKFFLILPRQWKESSRWGIGEPDFPTPANILQAGMRSMEEKGTAYTANVGLIELRRAISNYFSSAFKLEYDPADQILVTVGASEAVDIALRAVVSPGR